MRLPFRRRKPTSIHGVKGPSPASTAQTAVWSGWIGAYELVKQGRIEEAVEMHLAASNDEEYFLWGKPFTDERKNEIRASLREKFTNIDPAEVDRIIGVS